MGFFSDIFGSVGPKEAESVKRRKSLRNRICRIEEVEQRELLSATPYEPPDSINVGIVYHEDYYVTEGKQEDRGGDTFVVSWNGGADGTKLEKIVIDLSKGGIDGEYLYFNTDGNDIQPDNGYVFDFTVMDGSDVGVKSHRITKNGQCLEIIFDDDFEAGMQFKFKIDVNLIQKDNLKPGPVVDGYHFERVGFEAVFTSENYENLTYSGSFKDTYGDPGELNLSVPPDEWFENGDDTHKAMTAGVVETVPKLQTPLKGSISGYVYEDVNNDGLKAPNEAGIKDVWLELFVLNKSNQYESTGLKVQTDADGYYIFENVEGGRTYKVVETQPDGYADGKDTAGTIDGVKVGQPLPTDEIAAIHIGANEKGVDYNFGELKRASLSGNVYHDRNNNGIREAGEEGIAGVKITLQVLNGQGRYVDVTSTVTGTDGSYLFENLDPFQTYRVVETQPEGWSDGLETVGTVGGVTVGGTNQDDKIGDILLKYDESGVEYNFGEYKTGSISGIVYEDDNDNGKKDPGEPGIDGVTIWLCVVDEHGNKVNIRQTVTKDGGKYSFDDLEPGKTYCVTEVDPEGYCDGETSVGTIIGKGETGSVNEDVEPGFDQIHDIYIDSGDQGINYNFGENLRGSLSGYVYDDANENGSKDFGEKGIAGVTLTLWVWSEEHNDYIKTSKTAVTDADGYYEFDGLCPFRNYRITEAQPEDYLDGEESIGIIGGKPVGTLPENDTISDILLPPGGKGTDYNFGEQTPPPEKGSLGGYVYVDKNKNGTKDSGEEGIGGVTLTLWKLVDGQYVDTGRTTVSAADGSYLFEEIDPNETYMIAETQPASYDDGRESLGSLGGVLPSSDNDTIQGIFVGPGQHGTDYNFGEHERKIVDPTPKPGSISGYVYVDANKNGTKDSGEKGIGGVTLKLWKLVDGRYVETGKTATTDANGRYIFTNLDPDETYLIAETQPKAYDDGRESVGSLGGKLPSTDNDTIRNIFVGDDQHGTDYNFGEFVKEVDLPDPEKGSLSGYVYVDKNKNGTRDSGEAGIKNVVLTLWKLVDGQYVDTKKTATTDSNGFYIFTDLDPNETYMIAETQPKAYDDGRESVGSLGGKLPSTDNDTILDIAVGDDQHGTNYNFGEFVKPVDPPITPPTPPTGPPMYVPQRPIGTGGGGGAAATAPTWQAPYLGETLQAGYGGGGLPSGYSWHLSVINGGYPRDTAGVEAASQGLMTAAAATQRTLLLDDAETADADAKTRYVSVAWTPMPENQSVWYVRDKDGNVSKKYSFGPTGGTPLVADFSGDGIANLAVYHNGQWYIDINGNGQWDEEDLLCELGTAGDQPIVGDWDGDGKADIGIFGPQWAGDETIVADEPGLPSDLNTTVTARPKNIPPEIDIAKDSSQVRAMRHSQSGQVRLDVIDHVFQYGGEGDKAFAGDFSGDGITKIGVYRNGQWYIDYNGNGQWDDEDIYVDSRELLDGAEGIPIVGDFTGDGIANIGLFVDGVWHLDTTGDFQFDKRIEFGQPGDMPVVGDFDGDGIAELSVYRASGQDSLLTQTPAKAPAVSVGTVSPQYALSAETETPNSEGDSNDAETDQGTLPKELQRHGRSMRTPHSNAPLHRHHRR